MCQQMKFIRKTRRAMTLLEIMIVIFIIGIISSVIGYNMKGSLEKAKAFKTTEGIKKITEIFELELAQGTTTMQKILNMVQLMDLILRTLLLFLLLIVLPCRRKSLE